MKDKALPSDLSEQVRRALQEDVGTGDLTAALVPHGAQASATVTTREDAILCGTAWFDEVFRQLEASINITWLQNDGDAVTAGQVLCKLTGDAAAMLTGERTALNFLQTLSGTATATRRYADMTAGTNCRILDTRKTIPGLRTAQKYAVCCGGGDNHRLGLFDAVLIKENHIASAGGISAAVKAARRVSQNAEVEVEVENLAEVKEALAADADILLLDNFSLADLAAAVKLNTNKAKLEASGGIELAELAAIAKTGVDFISIGALTKHVQAIDLSMRFEIS
ncbi:MAG: carboxylating nicotinate-nucleotide diphosphorylase [Gammaproteobacteria bacterium]|nr:carboxylating nicotinate-nucleotide diphosphorylase [Gammaproteobacteria bacterium]